MTRRSDFLWLGAVLGLAAASSMSCSSAPSDDAATSTSALDGTPRFLVEEGVGTDAEARQYYASLGAAFVPGTYTLDQWVSENLGSRPVKKGFYRNTHELGFWREMTCTTYVGRGIGGCMVRNWTDPSDIAAGRANQGTVTMSVSPEGFTRFFVFSPTGQLSPFAILDDEGKKFVPRVCIACHSGRYDPSANSSFGRDMGAIFREFEPSQLEAQPGRPAAAEWFDLNQSIRSANTAIKLEVEGGPTGIDHAKTAQNTYVRSIYPASSPAGARDVRDLAHLPPSWAPFGETPTLLQAKQQLWQKVVAPYCMTCHRSNALDWADYSQFQSLGSSLEGKPLLGIYLAGGATHQAGFPFMPQAKLLFDDLQRDPGVKPAIDGWVAALGGPVCEVGTACTPSKVCFKGVVDSCTDPKKLCKATSALPDGTACGENKACSRGECSLSTLTFSIPRINAGIYVRSERPDAPEAHVHIAVDGHLLVAQVSTAGPCARASTQVSLDCNLGTLTCAGAGAPGDSWKVLEGNTLQRKNPTRPEVEGRYRLESPIDVASCP